MKSIPINLVGAISIVTMLLCVYCIGIAPLFSSQAQLENVIQETQQLARQSSILIRKNDEIQARIDSSEQALEQRYCEIIAPGQPMIETMSRLLTKHDLELSNLRKTDRPAEKSMRINLQIQGGYDSVMRFLYDLSRMSVPARVVSMQVAPTPGSSDCTGAFQIDFFPQSIVSKSLGGQHGKTL
ncbi:MAG: hypothetical protein Aurels2KO_13760 [Aureliella sp.]